jgi:hypothetical protein
VTPIVKPPRHSRRSGFYPGQGEILEEHEHRRVASASASFPSSLFETSLNADTARCEAITRITLVSWPAPFGTQPSNVSTQACPRARST